MMLEFFSSLFFFLDENMDSTNLKCSMKTNGFCWMWMQNQLFLGKVKVFPFKNIKANNKDFVALT